ncbi:unnamed protein product [Dibothriocephalus latus]|uniref:Uncharacterized protein n=1 Tax=Dibothriocephalus latus TaxID=60516 RepID=A0A3P6R8P5_DIBLA|nr:unnamed protein product [Dibothriocephalus latus]
MEPDFDSLVPDGIVDFIDYTKLHQLTSGLEDTTTAQPIGSKAGVETATAESPQESGEPTSPSSPPTRQNALPSIESWVRNANFSP